jgi:hypothetical protein
MEWVLILIGVGYSLWSSYKKEAKEREQKLRPDPKITAKRVADELFAQSSGRRTLSRSQPSGDINVVPVARSYGRDVSTVQELSVEDVQEDFTTRLNRKLMERGKQAELRRSGSAYENFGDFAKSENERIRDYDDLPSYDDRSASTAAEHDPRSHFKLNEGLRKDAYRVTSGPNAFEQLDSEEEAERVRSDRPVFTLDRRSLQSYIVMHEVLDKPRSLRLLGRKR